MRKMYRYLCLYALFFIVMVCGFERVLAGEILPNQAGMLLGVEVSTPSDAEVCTSSDAEVSTPSDADIGTPSNAEPDEIVLRMDIPEDGRRKSW